MAEKGFGVKEINLIGPSGTPTITSPNNLNLNAVNVAISTNVSIGGTLSVTGNVSVGGTLTYEDVTNIDSVGIVTARTGVVTPNLDVDDFISVGSNIHLGNAGVVTATTFSGSAASLTSVPAANITGTLPAISGANLTGITITPTDSDIQVVYTVTANGTSAYRFAGNGVVSTADNPDLYFIRGKKYRFINNSGGSHPFQIRESSGGSAYSTGVTNNGASSGNIDFAPTFDSPSKLVYQCTSHGGMVGNIYIQGGSSDIKMCDQWRRAAVLNTNNAENFITTDWERVDGSGQGTYINNGGMTESGGIFTFPRTGIYLVTWQAYAECTTTSRVNAVNIYITTNNNTYANRASSLFSISADLGSYNYGNGHSSTLVDVTDTSQVKVKFRVYSSGNVAWDQSSSENRNCATFLRIGDT